MKIAVVGAGAIGCWVGAQLAQVGHAVTLIGRPPLVQAVQQRGLQVRFVDGDQWQLSPAQILASTALSDEHVQGADAIVLCMKAYAVASALSELQRFGDRIKDAKIVGFQNGYGTDEVLAQAFPNQPVIAATTTTPVAIEAPGIIRIERMDGGIGLANVSGTKQGAQAFAQYWLAPLASSSTTQIVPPEIYADYRAMRWSKLLLNCIGNASGAILDLPPAQLFGDPRLFRLEMRMVREILAVMRAMQVAVVDLPGYPARSLARAVTWLPDGLLQKVLANRLARGRGDKRPSFYYDVANRTGQSEVAWLNGAVAVAGAQHAVPTPVNAALNRVLMDIIAGKTDPALWRGATAALIRECA